jgi:hypothetical protein
MLYRERIIVGLLAVGMDEKIGDKNTFMVQQIP